ncbi:hypothetical protein GCM10020295_67110 [Streptomyces cinereospinus]
MVATLVDPKGRFTVSDFAVRQGAVFATLLGYSSSDVPTCCPDLEEDAKWQWSGGRVRPLVTRRRPERVTRATRACEKSDSRDAASGSGHSASGP